MDIKIGEELKYKDLTGKTVCLIEEGSVFSFNDTDPMEYAKYALKGEPLKDMENTSVYWTLIHRYLLEKINRDYLDFVQTRVKQYKVEGKTDLFNKHYKQFLEFKSLATINNCLAQIAFLTKKELITF